MSPDDQKRGPADRTGYDDPKRGPTLPMKHVYDDDPRELLVSALERAEAFIEELRRGAADDRAAMRDAIDTERLLLLRTRPWLALLRDSGVTLSEDDHAELSALMKDIDDGG